MKRLVMVLVSGLFASSGALAADPPSQSFGFVIEAERASFSWIGPYVGANISSSKIESRVQKPRASGFSAFVAGIDPVITAALPKFDRGETAFRGGVQLGINQQFGHFVAGVEVGLNYLGHDRVFSSELGSTPITTTRITPSTKLDWLGTAKLRAGVAFDQVLLYATGGVAIGNLNLRLNVSQDGFGPTHAGAATTTSLGWTVGGGAEYALTEQITFRTDYSFFDLGRTRVSADPVGSIPPGTSYSYNFKTRGHLFRAGVNYRF